MRFRRSLSLLLALVALAGVAGCSSDDSDGPVTSTTTSTTTTPEEETTTTLSDEEFADSVEERDEAIGDAGDDLCAVFDSAASLAEPVSPAQVEESITIITATYEALARIVEADDADAAATLRQASTDIAEQGEAADHSMEFWNEVETMASDRPELAAALTVVQDRYLAECTSPAEGDGGD